MPNTAQGPTQSLCGSRPSPPTYRPAGNPGVALTRGSAFFIVHECPGRRFVVQSPETPYLSVITTTDPVARQLPRLLAALSSLAQQQAGVIQAVIVDDLRQWQGADSAPDYSYPGLSITLISPPRRLGQARALSLGITHADAPVLMTIDPDLHACVQEIPAMMSMLGGGIKAVHGHRMMRPDTVLSRRIGSYLANQMVRLLTGLRVHDIGSPITLLDRCLLTTLQPPDSRVNARLYMYLALGPALATYSLKHGTDARTPSQYSLIALAGVFVRLLRDSLRTRRAIQRLNRHSSS